MTTKLEETLGHDWDRSAPTTKCRLCGKYEKDGDVDRRKVRCHGRFGPDGRLYSPSTQIGQRYVVWANRRLPSVSMEDNRWSALMDYVDDEARRRGEEPPGDVTFSRDGVEYIVPAELPPGTWATNGAILHGKAHLTQRGFFLGYVGDWRSPAGLPEKTDIKWVDQIEKSRPADPERVGAPTVSAHDPGHPHLVNGEFQSDKYPTTPRGKVPLSCKDPTAQDLLWEYAQRRRSVDAEFATDLEAALRKNGYEPPGEAARGPRVNLIDTKLTAVYFGAFERVPGQDYLNNDGALALFNAGREYERRLSPEEGTLADRVGPINRYSADGIFVGAPSSRCFVEAQRRHGTWDFFLPRPASPGEAVWFGWALIAAGKEAAK